MSCIKKINLGRAKIEIYDDFIGEDKKSIKNSLLDIYDVVWKISINDDWFYSVSELDSLSYKGYVLIR